VCYGGPLTATWLPEAAREPSDLRLNVRVGWITRIEDIPQGAEIAVAATKATVQAARAYCQNHPPGT